VDLTKRTLIYFEDGEEILTTTVAIGSDRNPTPTGSFFVTDNVTLANPNSPWGPHALGLSGRSDTITEFNGGDGIIGIHGTNNAASIGEAASLGCVRVPNEIITELHEIIPIGTPVQINA
jgi:lipoprotein-anchoring transpeptidase ErfK/SrfK